MNTEYLGNVHLETRADLELLDLFRHLVDFVGKGDGGRTASRDIVLDAEVTLGATRVMTGCENETPAKLFLPTCAFNSWGDR